MSELHVRQIRATIERLLAAKIDVSDVANKSAEDQTNAFLTRGLAATSLAYVASIDLADAVKALTDGYDDNGIDALYYHGGERLLYVVQSKWRHDGNGTIDRGEMQKFLKGLRDLLNARWDRFNTRISGRAPELDAALDDSRTRIVLLVTYTGQQQLAPDIVQDLQDEMAQLNDPSPLVSAHVLRQGDVYTLITVGLSGAPINVDVTLFDWGQIRDPYVGFYGQVAATDVAAWYAAHQSRLFAPNIRMFLGETDVNDALMRTLTSNPKDFWYFNNGITALCRSVTKKPIGGSTRETGEFACSDLRIVNGAQTVGAIASAQSTDPAKVAEARVGIRLISLESCPPDFDKQVTRFTNTQNRIDRRDFVALDQEHERIRGELRLDGVTYAYKAGDTLPSVDVGFDLVEATVARACVQSDVAIAVLAKREIGKLWEEVDKAPYKKLFNPGVTGPSIWRAVQVTRMIEKALASMKWRAGRKRLLTVHGNRFITHLVLVNLAPEVLDEQRGLPKDIEDRISKATKAAFDAVLAAVDKAFPDAYLGSLFKNAGKCLLLKGSVDQAAIAKAAA